MYFERKKSKELHKVAVPTESLHIGNCFYSDNFLTSTFSKLNTNLQLINSTVNIYSAQCNRCCSALGVSSTPIKLPPNFMASVTHTYQLKVSAVLEFRGRLGG